MQLIHAARRLTLAVGLLAIAGEAPAQQCRPKELVTVLGRQFDANVDMILEAKGPYRVIPDMPGQKTASARLLLQSQPAPDASWRLVLRDLYWRVLVILGPDDFKAPNTQIWTGRFDVEQIWAELMEAKPGDQVSIRGGFSQPAPKEDVKLFSIQGGTPNWEPLALASAIEPRKWGDKVGMLVSAGKVVGQLGASESSAWCCSGVMVAPDIFLTNWHCGATNGSPDAAYWTSSTCENTIIDLGWDDGDVRRQYSCRKVLLKDARLDYALLEIRPVVGPGGAVGPANVVALRADRPKAGDGLRLIHHAMCRPKLLSACTVQSANYPAWTDTSAQADQPDLTHNCDSETGASGGPLFNTSGEMVALHHLGFNKPGQCLVPDTVNKAVTTERILVHVEQRDKALYARLRIAN